MSYQKIYTESEVQNVAEDIINIFKSEFIKGDRQILTVGLVGDLGAGKTTLTKKIFELLGVMENVVSPTFILRKDYTASDSFIEELIHIDAYRLEQKEGMNWVLDLNGINKKTIVIVEWAGLTNLAYDMTLSLEHTSDTERTIRQLN